MELLPAIDVRGGEAVRLTQGDFDREVRYGDPTVLAVRYVEAGATWIHVVDLDAARTGVAHERSVLRRILDVASAATGRVSVVPDTFVSSDALDGFGWPAGGDSLIAELSFTTKVQVTSWYPGAAHLAVAAIRPGPSSTSLIVG